LRLRLTGVHGTDLGAGPALGAEFRVYDIWFAFCYGAFGALGQAHPAGDAVFLYVK